MILEPLKFFAGLSLMSLIKIFSKQKPKKFEIDAFYVERIIPFNQILLKQGTFVVEMMEVGVEYNHKKMKEAFASALEFCNDVHKSMLEELLKVKNRASDKEYHKLLFEICAYRDGLEKEDNFEKNKAMIWVLQMWNITVQAYCIIEYRLITKRFWALAKIICEEFHNKYGSNYPRTKFDEIRKQNLLYKPPEF